MSWQGFSKWDAITGRSLAKWPELGFSIAAWNGQDEPLDIGLSLHVGDYTDRPAEPNSLQADLSRPQPGNLDLLNAEILSRALLAMADAWEPRWGVLEDWYYRGWLTDAQGFPFHPWAGWLTYLSAPLAEKVRAPASVVVRDAPGGVLWRIPADEPYSLDNPRLRAELDLLQLALKPLHG